MKERPAPRQTGEKSQEVHPNDFPHVTDVMLRDVLQANPRHVKPPVMRQALEWTLDALGRDVINEEVPPTALEERIHAARTAKKALTRGQRTQCHGALRRFWSI